MGTFIEIEDATKILRYVQYRIAQKFSAGEDVLSLLPSADIATCLYMLEQMDTLTTPKNLYH